MYDAGDREQVERAGVESRRRLREASDTVRTVLATPQGRRWMFDLLSACHVFEANANTEPVRVGFFEGERNIGLFIMAQVHRSAADLYLLMMKEAEDAEDVRVSKS